MLILKRRCAGSSLLLAVTIALGVCCDQGADQSVDNSPESRRAVVEKCNAAQKAAAETKLQHDSDAAFPGWAKSLGDQCDDANERWQRDWNTHIVGSAASRARVLVISDLHAGLGGQSEDFRTANERFDRLRRRFSDGNSVLVLAGDIFDMAEAAAIDRGRTAVQHIKAIGEKHSGFFNFLSQWLLGNNDVVFVPGNHDMPIQLSAVQKAIVDKISEFARHPSDWRADIKQRRWVLEHTRFHPFCFCTDHVTVMHGHQWDAANMTGLDMNRADPDADPPELPWDVPGARAGIRRWGERCLFDQTKGIQVIDWFVALEREAPWLDNIDAEDRTAVWVDGLRDYVKAKRKELKGKFASFLQRLGIAGATRGRATVTQCERLSETWWKSLSSVFGRLSKMIVSESGRRRLRDWASVLPGNRDTSEALRSFAKEYISDRVFVAGHTHEPALVEDVGEGGYYANSGTWTLSHNGLEDCDQAVAAWPKSFSSRSPVIVINVNPGGRLEGAPEVEYMDSDPAP